MNERAVAAVVVLSLGGIALAGDPPPMYTITDLGLFLGLRPNPFDLNNAGQVVVSVRPSGQDDRTAIWQDGVFEELPLLPGTTRGIARAIADDGTVAGSCGPFDALLATVWIDGVPTDIGSLGGPLTDIMHISPAGVISGYGRLYDGGPTHGFLYRDGVMTDLGAPLGFEGSFADVCDDAGNVAWCWGDEHEKYTPHYWDAEDGIRSMASLGGVDCLIFDMNNAGLIVGWANDGRVDDEPAFLVHLPVVWFNGGVDRLELPPGFNSGEARSVNEKGLIVGQARNFAQGTAAAVVWLDGQVVLLQSRLENGAGWTLATATACNDAGQIIGIGTLNGQSRAFLLTPTEPRSTEEVKP
ncbi:MAG: hypothetical protein R3B57_10390 [Phycisphaerales bacterium]